MARATRELLLPLLVAPAGIAVAAEEILAGRRWQGGLLALVAAFALNSLAGPPGRRRTRRELPNAGRRIVAQQLADRVFDGVILAAIAWVNRVHHPRMSALALVALGASFLASYERARGQSLGYRGNESAPYRWGREALIVLGLLTGWVEPVLWAFAALAGAASLVRARNVVLHERRHPSPRGSLAVPR
jgi:CDP-diacylglycerol---glycerol-3-phosphate 3-phosphatidyltransferase